jgi:hypothetical protein
MRAYNERAASKSGRAHVVFSQDLCRASIRRNETYRIIDGKRKRLKLLISGVAPAVKLNGDYYVHVFLSKDDLIQLLIEAFGRKSLVAASRPAPKRSRPRTN